MLYSKKNSWQDIKDTWNNQPESENINIEVSRLLNDFKANVSAFEKDSIKTDITKLKQHWNQLEDSNKLNQFEKDFIEKVKTKNNIGLFAGIGASVGLSMGITFGIAFDALALGISLGVIIGAGFGVILWFITQKMIDKKD